MKEGIVAMDDGRVNSWKGVRPVRLSSGQANVATREFSISGERVLLGMAIATWAIGLFLWAFVRYWLFAP